jgi:hypothetical protein
MDRPIDLGRNSKKKGEGKGVLKSEWNLFKIID